MKFKSVCFKKVVLPDDLPCLQFLADNLRALDKKELLAQGYKSVFEGLELSTKQSQEAYLGFAKGQVVCIFGVSKNYYANLGYPAWFLATDIVWQFKKEFLHYTKLMVKKWLEQYGCLHNYVLQENVQSIRWLKWLGANFADVFSFGKEKFILFTLKGDD